jgi:predicted dehydrogenase
MTKVGVIGLGMMGGTHLDVYAKRDDVQVVAVSDQIVDRLSGTETAAGNVEGQAQGGFDFDAEGLAKYAEGMDLIADANVELVDICLPTPLHMQYAVAALEAGKHLMVEKPLARTYADAQRLVAVAEQSPGMAMCGMCMRFWPGWTWLKQAVDDKRFGAVKSVVFQRITSHPGGGFYSNGEACGGALLDLHIHDTDFVQHLFGLPKSVSSFGYSKATTHVDHIVTRYEYEHVPLVIAEGAWSLTAGYGFTMRYIANFDKATAVFDPAGKSNLMLFEEGKDAAPVELDAAMGYELEIAYLLNCIKTGEAPSIVTLADAAKAVLIAEAEEKSVAAGHAIKVVEA